MLLRINDQGYSIHDIDGMRLFAEENEHDSIFDFAAVDISPIGPLLQRYICSILNIESLQLITSSSPDKQAIAEIRNVLDEAHPLFQLISSEAIARAIAEYFNQLLIFKSYTTDYEINAVPFTQIFDYTWYHERLFELIADLIFPEDYTDFENKYYTSYKVITEGNGDFYPFEPICFGDLLQQQKDLNQWLFWILDITVPELNGLNTAKRKELFAEIFPQLQDSPIVKVSRCSSFSNPHNIRYRAWQNISDDNQKAPVATEIYSYYSGNTALSNETQKILSSLISEVSDSKNTQIFEEYDVDDISQLLFLEFEQLMRNGAMIKHCRHCGRYFIVENRNVEYCNRVAENDLTCSEIGPRRAYQKKMEEDYPLKIYNRAYGTKHAQRQRGILPHDQFDAWYFIAKEKLEQVRSEKLNVVQFETWLNDTKKIKRGTNFNSFEWPK